MIAKIDNTFDGFKNDEKSFVLEVQPSIFNDSRGSFSEVLKDLGEWNDSVKYPLWFSSTNWIRQINRSKSAGSVIRGCHAQRGIFCQGKLVEAVNKVIFDIITDARPNSDTFGVSKAYRLDPVKQNKVWVPRGFLHSFVTLNSTDNQESIFMYYVDNTYDKNSEICVNPMTILPDVVKNLKETFNGNTNSMDDFKELFEVFSDAEHINFSEKDKSGIDYSEFCSEVSNDFNKKGRLWYN